VFRCCLRRENSEKLSRFLPGFPQRCFLYAFFARTVSENLPILVVDLLRFLLISHVPVSTPKVSSSFSSSSSFLSFPWLSFPLDFEFVASFG
jgi:hypothetical protein